MKRNMVSFHDMLARIKSGPTAVPLDPSEGSVSRTFRFKPDVNNWLVTQSAALGVSINDFVSTGLKGLMVAYNPPKEDLVTTVNSRFFSLFKEHGVATANIPLFLPPGTLKRSDLLDSHKVLAALDESLVKRLSGLFYVNRDWLKGESPLVHEIYLYRRDVGNVFSMTLEHVSAGHGVEVIFALEEGMGVNELVEIENDESPIFRTGGVAVILKVSLGEEMDRLVTYRLWQEARWYCPDDREALQALLFFCDQSQTPYRNVYVDRAKHKTLTSGEALIPRLLEDSTACRCDVLWLGGNTPTDLEDLPNVKKTYLAAQGESFVESIHGARQISNNSEVAYVS